MPALHGAMARWRDRAMARSRDGAIARWRDGAMARSRDGAMARWRDGAIDPFEGERGRREGGVCSQR